MSWTIVVTPSFDPGLINGNPVVANPYIVGPVYDYGEYQGQPYLVMRLMRGGTLSQRLAPGPMNITDALPILEKIAAALDSAHKQGIIHRDLKPRITHTRSLNV